MITPHLSNNLQLFSFQNWKQRILKVQRKMRSDFSKSRAWTETVILQFAKNKKVTPKILYTLLSHTSINWGEKDQRLRAICCQPCSIHTSAKGQFDPICCKKAKYGLSNPFLPIPISDHHVMQMSPEVTPGSPCAPPKPSRHSVKQKEVTETTLYCSSQ